MTRTTLVLLLLAAAGTSGCGVLAPLPSPGTADPSPNGDPAGSPGERGAGDAAGGAATTSLLAVGRSARQSGDYEGATAYFEQALRIAPNDARLWVELGETKLVQGDTAQAEMMGRKALTLTGGDTGLESRARRLVESN